MTTPAAGGPAVLPRRSPWGDAARRFSRNRLAMFGLILLLCLGFIALFADVLAPYEVGQAFRTQRAYLRPFINPDHPLGLDGAGRDYLTRLIYGARTSLLVGLSVPLISFLIGVPLGALSGYRGGWIDFVIQRLVDVATAIPPLLFALFLLSVVGSGVENVIFVLAITGWIEPLRLTRAQFLAYREKDFVLSARALGATDLRIIAGHILPNAISPLLISFTFAVPLAIFAEAGLSFLGIGITEPTASWGKMVGSGIGSSVLVYYHVALFPTLLVAFTMLGFSFVGDGLQEALDPNRSR
ncbi:MAG: ABC transporter permease [Anaerolineae bacterium]|jgi:oligopeptide transport system permease protein|nr:ABC transporter permease [Anaerolineae bacterium]